MAADPPAAHTVRLSAKHARVLGWVASGDVLRDAGFAYRAIGRDGDLSDVVYELEALALVDLLDDGRVVVTPAGAQRWSKTRSRRHSGSEWHELQFSAAAGPPRS